LDLLAFGLLLFVLLPLAVGFLAPRPAAYWIWIAVGACLAELKGARLDQLVRRCGPGPSVARCRSHVR
jgi:hypothetical protein